MSMWAIGHQVEEDTLASFDGARQSSTGRWETNWNYGLTCEDGTGLGDNDVAIAMETKGAVAHCYEFVTKYFGIPILPNGTLGNECPRMAAEVCPSTCNVCSTHGARSPGSPGSSLPRANWLYKNKHKVLYPLRGPDQKCHDWTWFELSSKIWLDSLNPNSALRPCPGKIPASRTHIMQASKEFDWPCSAAYAIESATNARRIFLKLSLSSPLPLPTWIM